MVVTVLLCIMISLLVGIGIGIIGCLISANKKTTWGTIRLIGVDEETGQFNAAIVWPSVDEINTKPYVVLEVLNQDASK